MNLPRFTTDSIILQAEPLTPAGFAPFGTAITSPFTANLTAYPSPIPHSQHPSYQPQPVIANQATALKTSPISPLLNKYDSAPSNGTKPLSAGLMSIFSSFPRRNTYASCDQRGSKSGWKLRLGILERHPFTTQTFCPFNFSQPHNDGQDKSSTDDGFTYMLIVVAPSLPNTEHGITNPPDLNGVKAFFAPLGHSTMSNIAVTYSPGTWHAPMIVLGQRRVDFLVTQFASGIAVDDCQEVLVGNGPDEPQLKAEQLEDRRQHAPTGNVEIDLGFLKKTSRDDKLAKL